MKWFKANINDTKCSEFLYFYNLMTDKRKAEIKSLRSDTDKKLSIAGEMLAKKGISELSGISVSDIIIDKDKSGRPYAQDTDCYISISHSGEYAVCAVDIKPVGIDIEKIREVNIKTAKRFCNKEELEFINNSDNALNFFKIWTAKEAEFKKRDESNSDFKLIDTFKINKEYTEFENYIVCISKGAEK